MLLRKIFVSVASVIVILFSTTICAEENIDNILNGLIKINSSQLKNCADKGNKVCEINLGIFYAYKFKLPNGEVSQNIGQAKVWLNKTTLYPISRYVLGEIYINENSNIKLGESLLFSSCAENTRDACMTLYELYTKDISHGIDHNNLLYVIKKIIEIDSNSSSLAKDSKNYTVRYFNGKLARLLIKRKDPDAIPLLEKEVEADAPFASSLLAPLYETGQLATKNLTRAYMMYDLSGSGYADEKAKVAEQMTPAQVREAQEMSWRWQDEHRSYRAGYRGGDIGIHGKVEQR